MKLIMNKFLSLILYVSMIYACSNKIKVDNSLSKQNLRGKVKHIRASVYDATYKFGEAQKDKVLEKYSNEYNEDGYLLEFKSYRPDGILKSSSKFKYDNLGNETEYVFTNTNGSFQEKTKYEYKYDENGHQIEKRINDFNGRLRTKYVYKYNSIGNMIEQDTYASDSSHYEKIKFKYNSYNNITEKAIYDPDGSLNHKYKYNYEYFHDNSVREFEEKRFDSYGQLTNKFTKRNDSIGNVIETIEYYSDSKETIKHTFNYDYDFQGNWIKEIKLEGKEPTTITEREIEYYP